MTNPDADGGPVADADPGPKPGPARSPAEMLDLLPGRLEKLKEQVETVVVGQGAVVEAMVQALLSRGHCLLVGVPGLAKTLLVKTLARLLKLDFARIQFTPDLMPSDVTGTVILHKDPATGHRGFLFSPGPIFAHVVLADEINRTPPKTQAALLEAMQEKTVTVAGKTHVLEEPFLVLATQNPIEQEGTYPLPEAQLDRFLFQLEIEYPSLEDERTLVARHSFTPLEMLRPLFGRDEVLAYREAVAQIPAAAEVVDYAVRLCRASRPGDPTSPEAIRRYVRWGASPRASQNLILAARARAACQGRFHASREDVASVAPLVLVHRVVRSFQADADGVNAAEIVNRLIENVPRGTARP